MHALFSRYLRTTAVCAVTAAALAGLAGCGAGGAMASPGGDVRTMAASPAASPAADAVPAAGRAGRSAPAPLPQRLPGLGPKTLGMVPDEARQAVVVTGDGPSSSRSTVILYERTAAGWTAGTAWPAHNALKGWTDDHREGDLRSPIGVFTLTDAGGRLADPGTKLSYDHAPRGFGISGTGFQGEPLEGSFDYVISIDYNHVRGTTPRDWTRPMGGSRGGGIWLHVDHGGPTQGCVSLAQDVMKQLLRTLDPARHPVVVMGDAAALGR